MPGGIWRDRPLRRSGHLRECDVHLGPGVKEYFGDAAALHRLRFDVIDVGHRGGEKTLILRRDSRLHVLGAQAAIIPQHRDDRNVYVRKDVGGRAKNHQRADQENEQRQYDKRIRPVECDLNDPHWAMTLLDNDPAA